MKSQTKFVCDDWALISEQTPDPSSPTTNYYVYGLDLSSSMQGAGGMVNSLDSNVSSYTYDNTPSATNGSESIITPTPYSYVASLERYYGYRYYQPETGRWLSRDPIEEIGGINLYAWCGNSSLQNVDYLGAMSIWDFVGLFPVIGTLVNAIITPEGANVADYHVKLTYQDCCNDPETAESLCIKAIDGDIATYEGKYIAFTTVHALIDAIGALLGKGKVAVVLIADAMVDLAITGHKIDSISVAGKAAQAKCNCALLVANQNVPQTAQ